MLNHTDVKKTRAVIDLNAIAGNYTHTAKACAPAKVAAVVKADAYGHGALAVAKRLNAVGCDFFTVSNIDEALELRTGGITGTILVLGYVLDEFLPEAVENARANAAANGVKNAEFICADAGEAAALAGRAGPEIEGTGPEVGVHRLGGDPQLRRQAPAKAADAAGVVLMKILAHEYLPQQGSLIWGQYSTPKSGNKVGRAMPLPGKIHRAALDGAGGTG